MIICVKENILIKLPISGIIFWVAKSCISWHFLMVILLIDKLYSVLIPDDFPISLPVNSLPYMVFIFSLSDQPKSVELKGKVKKLTLSQAPN